MHEYEWEWRREGVAVDRALTVSRVRAYPGGVVPWRACTHEPRVNTLVLVGGAGLGDGG